MYFSKSFIASALLGLASATNHEVNPHDTAAAAPVVHESTVAVAASAHVSSAAVAAPHVSSVVVAAPHESTTVAVASPHISTPVAVASPHVSTAVVVHESTAVVVHESTAVVVHESTAVAVSESHAAVSSAPAVVSSAHASLPPAHSSPPAAHASQSVAVGGTVITHVVQVGGPNGTLVFSPENVVAAAGDLVQFQFNPKNHSVVQSTFDQPCVPIQNIMPNKTDAFFSGFMPANATSIAAGNVLTYTIRVMDTKPIWFYCSQGPHCQAGMVGAINAVATGNKTLEAFKVLAKAAPENLSPGQAPGQGVQSAPGGVAAPSGGVGATQSVAGGAPTVSSPNTPAQQTVNAAGRVSQTFVGLAVTVLAAFMVL